MIRLKRFCGKFTKVPPRFEGVTGQVRFPTALALVSPAITKFLGQNDTFVFLSSLQQMAFASQRFFGPQTVFFFKSVGLTISRGFLGKWLLLPKVLQKMFCERFRQLLFLHSLPPTCAFTSIFQLPPGVNVA